MASHYWAACTAVWNTISTLQRSAFSANPRVNAIALTAQHTMPDVPEWIDSLRPARNIVESAERFFSPTAGFWGPFVEAYPICVALHYFASQGMATSEETMRLRLLTHSPRTGAVARQWLRSAITQTGKDQRDPAIRAQYDEIVTAWFGRGKADVEHVPASAEQERHSRRAIARSQSM